MKVIVSLSGGMDSATVLGEAVHRGHDVRSVSFTYGSKHNKYENARALELANHYGVSWTLIDLATAMQDFRSNLLQSGGEIPEGHYEDKSMSLTVVPGRNIIFISILSGLAWSWKCKEIWLGIHTGDHAIYPDCRPEFFSAMDYAVQLGTETRVRLRAPFLDTDKTGIIRRGIGLKVPYEKTRTCYKQQEVSCGKCGSCTERLEAFAANKVEDPIPYEITRLDHN